MTEVFVWIGFNIFILAMLALDFMFHRKPKEVGTREALLLSGLWISLALIFCLGIYFVEGTVPALNFLTGYLIEKSLSMDNLFVFLVIFSAFAVPAAYLHKVLLWGILGALVMRAIFIFSGIVLINKFHGIIYVFGLFLIFTGLKLFWKSEKEMHPEENIFLKLLRKIIPMTKDYEGDRFIVKKDGRYWATPLLAVLITIETTDIIFALDSVPAILAITTDPFIVYTSNVFAILGLRSLFFALAGLMPLFHYLHYGLAAMLIFIGTKMLMVDYIDIPIIVTLAVIALILGLSILASLMSQSSKHKS